MARRVFRLAVGREVRGPVVFCGVTMSRREFQFEDGSSSKFWAIELAGSSFTVNWGRIGTSGQTQTKDFSSDSEASKQHDKLVAEKLKKGYAEIGAAEGAAAKPAVAATPKPASAPAKAKAKTATPEAAPEAETTKEPTTPSPTITPVFNTEVTRSIDLSPSDWLTATWRPRTPIPRPSAQPFDLESCVARVVRVTAGTYGWRWDWEMAHIPIVMTPEEAHFWLSAMSQASNIIKPRELADKLAQQEYKAITGEEGLKLSETRAWASSELLLPLSNLIQVGELVAMIAEASSKAAGRHGERTWKSDPEIIFKFRKCFLPYLTEAEIQTLRDAVASQLDVQNWPTDFYHRPPGGIFLGAVIGMPDKLLGIAQSWAEGFYVNPGWDHTHYHQPQIIVFGLGNAATVEAQMRRNKLPLNRPEYIRGWLATTEYAALDYARDCILAITNRDECEKLVEAFARVKAPEAAPHMLELKLSSKAPKLAREWLDENLGCAIAGLIPVAEGRGRLADAAIEHLRDLKRAGHGDLIRKAAGNSAPERLRSDVLDYVEKAYKPFDKGSTPEWLESAMADAPKSKLPAWIPPQSLPILVVGEHRLGDEQSLAVLGALQKCALDAPHPLLKALKKHASPESRDAFAWRLFELWTAEGAPSEDKWAMGAIGHLGADGCVLKLTPMIRNWPGESQHQRAVFGLECLRAVGSDIALMQLNGIAQKLKFKGLKSKAMEFMEAIASQRNMTRAELEDRIVPDLDLDEKGTRLFDFGPRQFRFVLGPDLKAMIKDVEGKVRSDLPSPNAKDDAAKAEPAVETWKLLKKQIREIGKVQAERLEQSMVTRRRWKTKDFESLLVKCYDRLVRPVRALADELAAKLASTTWEMENARKLIMKLAVLGRMASDLKE